MPLIFAIVFLVSCVVLHADTPPDKAWRKAAGGRDAVFVLAEVGKDGMYVSNAAKGDERRAPCSTFKIWNSLIGLETGVVTDPDALFWKWDGKHRFLPEWSRDQTLRSAIKTSCVPAFQAFARKIGRKRMQRWIDVLGYGDRDISAGVDVFWLPDPPKRKTILISPVEQVRLLSKLLEGKLPISSRSFKILSDITTLATTSRGVLHGKTGTELGKKGKNVGWFVGWVEHDGKKYAFACVLKGRGVMGADARELVKQALVRAGLL